MPLAILPVFYHCFKVPTFLKSQTQIPPPQIPPPIQMELISPIPQKCTVLFFVSPVIALSTIALLTSLSFPIKCEHLKDGGWDGCSPHSLFNPDRVFHAVNALSKSLLN